MKLWPQIHLIIIIIISSQLIQIEATPTTTIFTAMVHIISITEVNSATFLNFIFKNSQCCLLKLSHVKVRDLLTTVQNIKKD